MSKNKKALKRGSAEWSESEEKRKQRIENFIKLRNWSNDEQVKKMLELYSAAEKRIQDRELDN